MRVDLTKKIRDIIEDRGYTQQELEEVSGLHRSAISRMLNPKHDPRVSTVEALLDALNCDLVVVPRKPRPPQT
ncbi:MAG: helix-turn-helix domain-containing protein [Phycisphaerales bacterium JB063]